MEKNYFNLLQLPVALPIDSSLLTLHYQQLQRQFHPDNYATSPDSGKAAILQQSASINAAYQTLKDPIKAAEYRLSLEGININEEQQTIHDSSFLMEQFMLREQLDELEHAQNWDELTLFYDEMIERKNQIHAQLLEYINQSHWLMAKQQLYKLRYYAKLIEQIELLQEKQFNL